MAVGVLYTALGYAAPEIKAERLVPLLEDWRTPSAAIFLYYPSRRAAAGFQKVPAREPADALGREGEMPPDTPGPAHRLAASAYDSC
jgi:hypothetical protein